MNSTAIGNKGEPGLGLLGCRWKEGAALWPHSPGKLLGAMMVLCLGGSGVGRKTPLIAPTNAVTGAARCCGTSPDRALPLQCCCQQAGEDRHPSGLGKARLFRACASLHPSREHILPRHQMSSERKPWDSSILL